jgi:CRISPR-associated protein Cas1
MAGVYVDRRGAAIELEGEAMVIRTAEGRTSLPLSRVERLVIRAPACLSAGLLARLWAQDGGVLVLSGRRNEPTARFLGKPGADVTRRIAQYRLQDDAELRWRIAGEIVRRKILGQSRCLAHIASRRPGLAAVISRARADLAGFAERAGAVDKLATLDALRGVEGAAAACYFRAFGRAFAPGLGFDGRNRRPPRDPVNAALSLAYTLATFEASRQAQIAGLDPMLGALHDPAHGRDSLACDLVEGLRPRIDCWVYERFATRDLRAEGFTCDAEGRVLLGKAARSRFYERYEDVGRYWSRWLARAAHAFRRAACGGPPVGIGLERIGAAPDG